MTKLHDEQRGFVLSGIALLLVLPAMLLAASCFRIIETGGEAVSLQAAADKVFYTGEDIERVIKNMWDKNLLADNEPNANAKFDELADNYRAATGLLVDLTPSWMLWQEVQDTGSIHTPGTKYCLVEGNALEENWYYRFEELDEGEWGLGEPDYDEPILFVEKLDGKLRITLENYGGIHYSDINYSDENLWDDVTTGSLSIGDNREVDGVVQLRVSVYVRDPRGAAQYSSTVELG